MIKIFGAVLAVHSVRLCAHALARIVPSFAERGALREGKNCANLVTQCNQCPLRALPDVRFVPSEGVQFHREVWKNCPFRKQTFLSRIASKTR
jgi:hypothetical protein